VFVVASQLVEQRDVLVRQADAERHDPVLLGSYSGSRGFWAGLARRSGLFVPGAAVLAPLRAGETVQHGAPLDLDASGQQAVRIGASVRLRPARWEDHLVALAEIWDPLWTTLPPLADACL